MKKIRTEMWALVNKGRFVRDARGGYVLTSTRKAVESIAAWRAKGETTTKVTVTIQPI